MEKPTDLSTQEFLIKIVTDYEQGFTTPFEMIVMLHDTAHKLDGKTGTSLASTGMARIIENCVKINTDAMKIFLAK